MDELLKRVQALEEWRAAREVQQITSPFDDVSRLAMGVITGGGSGSTPVTQSLAIAAVPVSITVPKAPIGTLILRTPDGDFEIPHF